MKTVTITDVPHGLVITDPYQPGVVTKVTFTEEQRQEIFEEFEGENISDICWEESELIQSYETNTNTITFF